MPPKRTLDGKSIGLEEERGQIQKSPPSPWEKDQRICLINLSIEYILRDVGNFPGTSCAQCTVAQLDTVYKEINYSLLISFYIMDTKTILEPQFAKIPQLSQLEYMFLIFMKKRSVTSLFWFRKSVVTFDDPYCIYSPPIIGDWPLNRAHCWVIWGRYPISVTEERNIFLLSWYVMNYS